jgi:pimeloyl-ACP methyl ester carboxylesterase
MSPGTGGANPNMSSSDGLVKRPDGAEIHWEEWGEGPPVAVIPLTLWSYPGVYGRLIADLARDHRVIVADPRGCGRSSRRGPYDMETDAGDLEAVLEAVGGGVLTIVVGDGLNRAIRVSAARPDLIPTILAIAPAPAAVLPRSELVGTGALAGSDSVVDMVFRMLETQPRAALRNLIATVNPDLDEEQLRERLDAVADYLTPEGAYERAQVWLEDDVRDQVRSVGGRLSILHGGADPMLGGTLAGRVTELFPDAHVMEMEDGPVSRPELTASQVRRLTGTASS